MKRKAYIAIPLLVAFIAVILLWPIEPSYDGHGLSGWLELRGGYTYTTNHWATLPEFDNAVRHIGRPAIPFMLRWIRYFSVSHRTIIEAESDPIGVVREILSKSDLEEFRAEGSVAAFGSLGSNAISALPELEQIASVPSKRAPGYTDPAWQLEALSTPNRRAIFALANIGPAAVPHLLNLATNQSANIQCDAVYLLSRMGSNALPAIPLLLHDIQNPANPVAAMAARTLAALKLSPETVIPALTNALANKKFLLDYGTRGPYDQKMQFLYEDFQCLAAYGPQAHCALPAMIEWLQVDDPFTPQWAADVLSNFKSEPKLLVPALTGCLESRNQYLVRSAARSLGAFGAAAAPAVPALLKISDNTDLMLPVRNAAGRALEQITNSVPHLAQGDEKNANVPWNSPPNGHR